MRREALTVLLAIVCTALGVGGLKSMIHPSDKVLVSPVAALPSAAIAPAPSQRAVVNGLLTADRLGVEPAIVPLVVPVEGCMPEGHSAVIDRAAQRTWLCDNGQVVQRFVMTSATSQPDPGQYNVFAKDLYASSDLTGRFSTMTHFVAFAYGKYKGARIAFHSIPQFSNGVYVQSFESVGTRDSFGGSAGCIRVLPADAAVIWDWLSIGDSVVVIS